MVGLRAVLLLGLLQLLGEGQKERDFGRSLLLLLTHPMLLLLQQLLLALLLQLLLPGVLLAITADCSCWVHLMCLNCWTVSSTALIVVAWDCGMLQHVNVKHHTAWQPFCCSCTCCVRHSCQQCHGSCVQPSTAAGGEVLWRCLTHDNVMVQPAVLFPTDDLVPMAAVLGL